MKTWKDFYSQVRLQCLVHFLLLKHERFWEKKKAHLIISLHFDIFCLDNRCECNCAFSGLPSLELHGEKWL